MCVCVLVLYIHKCKVDVFGLHKKVTVFVFLGWFVYFAVITVTSHRVSPLVVTSIWTMRYRPIVLQSNLTVSELPIVPSCVAHKSKLLRFGVTNNGLMLLLPSRKLRNFPPRSKIKIKTYLSEILQIDIMVIWMTILC